MRPPHVSRRLLLGSLLAVVVLLLSASVPGGGAAPTRANGLPSAGLVAGTRSLATPSAHATYLGLGNSFLQDPSIHSPPPTWSVAFQSLLPPGTSSLDGAFTWVDAGYEGSIAKIVVTVTDLGNGSSVRYLNGTTLALPEQWYNFSTSEVLPLNVTATYRVTLSAWCTLSATCLVGDGTTTRRALFLAFNRSTDLEVNSTPLIAASVGSPGTASYDLPAGTSQVAKVSTWVDTLPLLSQPAGWSLFVNLTLADTTHPLITWGQASVVTASTAQDLVFWPLVELRSSDLYTLQVSSVLSGVAAGGATAYLGGAGHEAWNMTVAAQPLLSLSTTTGQVPLPVLATSSPSLISGPGSYLFRVYSDNGSSSANSSSTGSGGQSELRYNWSGDFVPWEVLEANVTSSGLTYWALGSAPGPLSVHVELPGPMVVRTNPSPPDGRGPLLLGLTAFVPPRGSWWYYTVDWGLGAPQEQNGSGNASYTYPASPLGTYTIQVEACVFGPTHVGGNLCLTNPVPIQASTELHPLVTPNRSVSDAGIPVAFAPSVLGGIGSYTSFSWDFGDGLHALGNQTEVHTYALPGTYLVNLTVTDQAGDVGNFVLPYKVDPRLWANASGLPVMGPAPLPVELRASVSGGTTTVGTGFPPALANASVLWTFDQGENASGPLLTHVFPYPGTYQAVLWVNDTGGSHLRSALNITVLGSARLADWTTPRGQVSQTADSGAPGPTDNHILASATLGPGLVVGLAVAAPNPSQGVVVAAEANGTLWGLDPLTLATDWQTSLSTLNEGLRSGPSVADGRVFVLGGSATLGKTTLVALNASTGAIEWQTEVDPSNWPYGLLGTPVPVLGNVYVAGPDLLSAVNASTGALLWQEGLFGTLPNETLAYGDLNLYGQAPPTSWAPASVNAFSIRSAGYPSLPDGIGGGAWGIYGDGMVTLAGADGHLEGAVSGTPPWWDVGIGNSSTPLLPAALGDGRVFATNGAGPLVAVSELNGSLLWRGSAPALSAPVVGASSVYEETLQGTQPELGSFAAPTGAQQWTLALSGTLTAPPALCDGVLYAAETSGDLLAVGDLPLSVSVNVSSNRTSVGAPVDLHASVSGGSGATTSVGWLFSDGTTATGVSVQHVFASAGMAWAEAVASDTTGAVTYPATVQIQVLPLPAAPSVVLSGPVPGSVDVRWTPYTGPGFASYDVLVGIDSAPLSVNQTFANPAQTETTLTGLALDSQATVVVRVDSLYGGSNSSVPATWVTPLVGPSLAVQEAPGLPGVPTLNWTSLPIDHFQSWTVHLTTPSVGTSGIDLGLPSSARTWTGTPLPNGQTSTISLTVSTLDGRSATSAPIDFTPQWSAPTPEIAPNGLSLNVSWGASTLPEVSTLEVCLADGSGVTLGCSAELPSTGPGSATVNVPSAGVYDLWIQETAPDGFNVSGPIVSLQVSSASPAMEMVVGVLAGAAVVLLASLLVAWTLPLRPRGKRSSPRRPSPTSGRKT